ncbi:MAG: hypothetical protein HAW63_04605 [Bdellovibrionaceae bacterium]|nr:hypothetical protein [Pseudobdellovibrionaceae bacterium]
MFEITTYSKCIITGEHSVLRGKSAISVPLKDKFLKFIFKPGGKKLDITFNSHSKIMQLLFNSVFNVVLSKISEKVMDIKGKLIVESTLSFGVGLGSSAALCSAVSLWLKELKVINEDQVFNFAKSLEDSFHGSSSGVDIAASLSNATILFNMDSGFKKITFKSSPFLALSNSESKGSTKKAVLQVQNWIKNNHKISITTDNEMQKATDLILKTKNLSKAQSIPFFIEAFQLSTKAFNRWGLITPELKKHISEVKAMGAIATKPSGAGLGGCVLSLWKTKPKDKSLSLIKM